MVKCTSCDQTTWKQQTTDTLLKTFIHLTFVKARCIRKTKRWTVSTTLSFNIVLKQNVIQQVEQNTTYNINHELQ